MSSQNNVHPESESQERGKQKRVRGTPIGAGGARIFKAKDGSLKILRRRKKELSLLNNLAEDYSTSDEEAGPSKVEGKMSDQSCFQDNNIVTDGDDEVRIESYVICLNKLQKYILRCPWQVNQFKLYTIPLCFLLRTLLMIMKT